MIITTAKDGNDPSKTVLIVTLNQNDIVQVQNGQHLEVDCEAMELPFCAASFFKAEDAEAVGIMKILARQTNAAVTLKDLRRNIS